MGTTRKPDPERFCETCGTRMERKRFGDRLEDRTRFLSRRNCSQACGNSRAEVQTNSHRWRARQVQERTACKECGTTRDLHVHHIDRNPANNDPENLTTLCSSCHLRLHWQEDRPARLDAARRARATAVARGVSTRLRSTDGRWCSADSPHRRPS